VIDCIRSGKQRLVLGHQSLPLWLLSWGVSLERRNSLLYATLKGMLDPKLYALVRRKP
jgi:butyryl-CoA dehydrogenase